MGIFSRLADIVNSNLNSILANAEDPEKMIRLVIQEMEDTLVEVRSQAVRMIAERKTLERRARDMANEEAEWRRKAELALTRDREDLAKAALAARATVEQSRQALERQIALVTESLDQQHDDISKLQAKLADAKSREKALSLRHKAAQNRLRTRETLYDTRMETALNRFDQVERALDELEGKSEAFDLGRGGLPGRRQPSLHEELAALETDAAVEDELAALKRKLAERGASEGNQGGVA
ncbi:phage shock protein PspA [Acidomonas methanolica]|uniref:Phage shock protein A n=1 Tax=Acidomonas methanolica NBRC 104435 TaxID=1231351 RepID=A0A023D4I2_ACIMT|nr:phage shock protein PspA [Acidomonas methanolica]MBU2655598.1 phage shock protein PspA [Acidomonas methanolica]TCS21547.1 phage shock protein A (PspA) family protein [Acidomonas methanolica]GAJ29078.1 phage shock protein A [Acidomonas methanolica NBRC 104435]GBQ48161.1 phage shock protein A [Acidomonas methanolica]GEL00429.1 phage shock protein PspA [Acidomonas methanolica NBRC 104435]